MIREAPRRADAQTDQPGRGRFLADPAGLERAGVSHSDLPSIAASVNQYRELCPSPEMSIRSINPLATSSP